MKITKTNGCVGIDGTGTLLLSKNEWAIEICDPVENNISVSNFRIIGAWVGKIKASWFALKWIWSREGQNG